MLVKEQATGHLVEVLDLEALIDPTTSEFNGRYNIGEEMPDPQTFPKSNIVFCSGEKLPKCWVDVHYRDAELKRPHS